MFTCHNSKSILKCSLNTDKVGISITDPATNLSSYHRTFNEDVSDQFAFVAASLWSSANGVNLQAFPNPAKDVLWLNFGQADAWEVGLFDMQNRRVLREKSAVSTGRMRLQVDALAAGWYVLRVKGEKGLAWKKLRIEK